MSQKGNDTDDTDRLIASALQVNGRASWEAISRVIDLPSRTVMRRGQHLLDTRCVRVSTYVDASKLLHARGVLIRLETEMHRVAEVARSVAALPGASSVSVLEGSGDIAALVLVENAEAHQALLLQTLPAIPGLLSFEVSTVLRSYLMGLDWHAGILPAEQVEALRKSAPWHAPSVTSTPVVLDAVDQNLIDQLSNDGRATISMLAQDAGINAQTVRRRLDALFGVGVLRVRTEVAPSFFGVKVEAMLWLHIRGGDVESIGTALANHPSVRYCAALTGHAGLLVDGLFKDEEALFDFQNGVIGSLASVEIAESRVVLKAVRRGPLSVDDIVA
ncbi:Lrp/AsnC family transcriptional regulator [Rhodococcus sp. ABRD24]|uniref:Lrp/AsnC family transcriptional regulator n=1 Tax=Rhodococcus sp. ABRD24 TaxID=2507582 RepID=UPI00103B08ED|nr:Lrp/AsnC family transcriptional regulator [Rhodococcus sp. ABRD24]QBJ95247.1 Lrp/AsnC family transcriptional regulator [Rhodococcus sp. ABRD24]